MAFQLANGYNYDGYADPTLYNNQGGIGTIDYDQQFGLGRYGDEPAAQVGYSPAYDDGLLGTNYPGYGDESNGQQGYSDSSRPEAYNNQVGYVYDEPDTRFEHVNRNQGFDPEWYRIHRSAIPPNRINYLKDDTEEDTRFKDYRKDSFDPTAVKVDRTRPENIQKLKEGNLKPGGYFEGQSVTRSDFAQEATTPRKTSFTRPNDALQPSGEFQDKTTYGSDMNPNGSYPAPNVANYGQKANLRPDGAFDANTVYHDDYHQFDTLGKRHSKKPAGGLKQEGEFQAQTNYTEQYAANKAGDKAMPVKRQSQLQSGGDFDGLSNYKDAFQYQKVDRSQPAQRAMTALRSDGPLEVATLYGSNYQAHDVQKEIAPRHQGNLTLGGDLDAKTSYGDDYQQTNFVKKQLVPRQAGNLKQEGDFDAKTSYGDDYQQTNAVKKQLAPRQAGNLKQEGDFDAKTSYGDDYQQTNAVKKQLAPRQAGNLKQEGDFDAKTSYGDDYQQTNVVKKQPAPRQAGNLKQEGDFAAKTNYQNEFQGHEVQLPIKGEPRTRTALRPEGAFDSGTNYTDEFQKINAAKRIASKPEGALRLQGDFQKDTMYQGDFHAHDVQMPLKGEPRARTALKPEGSFDSNTQYQNEFQKMSNKKQIASRPKGALQTEGDFESDSVYKDAFQGFDVPVPIKGEPRVRTALKSEGSFDSNTQYQNEFHKMSNKKQIASKPKGALQLEGDVEQDSVYKNAFQGQHAPVPIKGEPRVRTALKAEGAFDSSTLYKNEYHSVTSKKNIASRPKGMLHPEGQLDGQTSYKNTFQAYEVEIPIKGEPRVRTALKPSGSFDGATNYANSFGSKKIARERGSKPQENLMPEGDFNGRTNYSEQFLKRPMNYQAPDRSPKAFNLHDNIKEESVEYVEMSSSYGTDYQAAGGLKRHILPRNKTALKQEGLVDSRTLYHDQFGARRTTERPTTYSKDKAAFGSDSGKENQNGARGVKQRASLSLEGEHHFETSNDDTFTVLQAGPPVTNRRVKTSLRVSRDNFPEKSLYKEEFQEQYGLKRRSMRPKTETLVKGGPGVADRSSYNEEFQEFDRKRPTMQRAHSSGDLLPVPTGSLDPDKEGKRKGLMRILHSNNPHSSAGKDKPSSSTFIRDTDSAVEPVILGEGNENTIALTFTQEELQRVLLAARANADARQQAAGGGTLMTDLRADGGGMNMRRKVSV